MAEQLTLPIHYTFLESGAAVPDVLEIKVPAGMLSIST